MALPVSDCVLNTVVRTQSETSDSSTSSITSRHNEKEQYVVETNNTALPLSSAVRTGLEPATSGVTGRHSNRLNYRTRIPFGVALRSCFPIASAKLLLFFGPCKFLGNFFQKKLKFPHFPLSMPHFPGFPPRFGLRPQHSDEYISKKSPYRSFHGMTTFPFYLLYNYDYRLPYT